MITMTTEFCQLADPADILNSTTRTTTTNNLVLPTCQPCSDNQWQKLSAASLSAPLTSCDDNQQLQLSAVNLPTPLQQLTIWPTMTTNNDDCQVMPTCWPCWYPGLNNNRVKRTTTTDNNDVSLSLFNIYNSHCHHSFVQLPSLVSPPEIQVAVNDYCSMTVNPPHLNPHRSPSPHGLQYFC
jgi:hypothetical protein